MHFQTRKTACPAFCVSYCIRRKTVSAPEPGRSKTALPAIINYGANHFRHPVRFADIGGLAEGAKEYRKRMLVTGKGVCVPCSSLFCYLMYLSGLPSMIVETPEPSDNRAHDWNLIERFPDLLLSEKLRTSVPGARRLLEGRCAFSF